jgi:thiol peroxidase
LRSISRKINETAGNLDNTAVLCISKFICKTFFVVQKLENVINLSDFQSGEFVKPMV